jgi:hypothetical protein
MQTCFPGDIYRALTKNNHVGEKERYRGIRMAAEIVSKHLRISVRTIQLDSRLVCAADNAIFFTRN